MTRTAFYDDADGADRAVADVPDGDKYALLSSWDSVLGLDLERAVRDGQGGLPDDVQALVTQRAEGRAARDFARSDQIRDQLTGMGYEVMDTAEGTRVRRRD